MKPHLLIAALLAFGVTGCDRQITPVTMDAPQLAASLKWVGVCAVICSTIGGVALVVATRGRRK